MTLSCWAILGVIRTVSWGEGKRESERSPAYERDIVLYCIPFVTINSYKGSSIVVLGESNGNIYIITILLLRSPPLLGNSFSKDQIERREYRKYFILAHVYINEVETEFIY